MTRYFIPALVVFITSVILLTLPGSAFPSENWMGDIELDKIIHIGMFGTLTMLFCWGFWKSDKSRQRNRSYFVITAVASLAYGIIMEYVQRDFVVNRSFDAGDIIADGIGSLAGLLFSLVRFKKK